MTQPARTNDGPRRMPGAFVLFLFSSSLAVLAPSHAGAAPYEPRFTVWGYSEGASFDQPRGIAFDPADGAIYVSNSGAHRIEVFSRTGRPLARFVHAVTRRDGTTGDGHPGALAFDRAGRLLVVDEYADYVDVLDRRGRSVARLPVPDGHPTALAVAADGTIFVGADGDSCRVHRFRPDYAPDGAWGVTGGDPGQLNSVTALGVLADGSIAVGCAQTYYAIQVFTPSGEYLRGFATHELGKGSVSLPCGVTGTSDGRIWVLDEIKQTIQVFDRDGVFIEQAGGRGPAPGQFARPTSLAADGNGLLAVTDRELGRFQVLGITQQK